MSTRALYTFSDLESSWNVYKHHDGYPSGAADTIELAVKMFAWQLPRFEADEFAGAFIAAAKCSVWMSSEGKIDQETLDEYAPKGRYHGMQGGGIRLMPQGDPLIVAAKHCADIAYRYGIDEGPLGIFVTAWSVDIPWNDKASKPPKTELLFSAPIQKFTAAAKRWEKRQEQAA